ncbi:MAG: hypothetical protein IPJ77_12250 [Planctomycetes bacterium]|nr:hypothetical protein [Planctomycetota bacterium]
MPVTITLSTHAKKAPWFVGPLPRTTRRSNARPEIESCIMKKPNVVGSACTLVPFSVAPCHASSVTTFPPLPPDTYRSSVAAFSSWPVVSSKLITRE